MRGRWAVTVPLWGLVAACAGGCRFDVAPLAPLDGGPAGLDAAGDGAARADGARDGTGPDGAAPDGALPDGALPDGALPDGAPPDGPPPVESCLNGVDDDGNGQTDCLDPTCQTDFYCVDAPPGSWSGFSYLHATAATDPTAPPACADGATPAPTYEGPIDLPAACSPCTCGATQDAACNPPTLTCWSGHDKCNGSGAADVTSTVAHPGCAVHAATGDTTSCEVSAGATVASDGTCPPSGGAATLAAAWSTRDDVCAATAMGGGCGAQVCARRPAAAYAFICVSRPGLLPCPGGWPLRHVTYTTTVDTRACTACSCAPGAASCTGGSYQLYGCDTLCADHCPGVANPAPFASGSGCQDVTAVVESAAWSSQYTPPTLVPGACTPAGGTPTGAVQRTGARTYCCRS